MLMEPQLHSILKSPQGLDYPWVLLSLTLSRSFGTICIITAFLTLPKEIVYYIIFTLRRYLEILHCKALRWLQLEHISI